MSARRLVLPALLVLAAGLALVQRAREPEPYGEPALAVLLRQPGQRAPWETEQAPRLLGHELLSAPFVDETPAGPRLSLGRVWAAPTVAALAAREAGLLLALEAEGPEGPTGLPLWRVILEGPSTEEGAERTLALYGCRHATDPDAGPVIDDTYAARLSLAQALEGHARSSGSTVRLRGAEAPVAGGVNFEVQLMGDEHAIRVTFDGHPALAYRARRAFRPEAPHEAAVRRNLVAALRALASEDARLAGLVIEGEEEAVHGGVDVRLEILDGRLALAARRNEARLRGSVSAASAAAQ